MSLNFTHSLVARFTFTACLLAGSLVLLQAMNRAEDIPHPVPLTRFPVQVGAWQGVNVRLDPREIAGAGVHDYVNRSYNDGAGEPVQLYIGYYPTQRTGDTIHSPKNCLPGSGWIPLRSGERAIPVKGETIHVNQYVVAKAGDTAVVLYWYQGRGRAVASEYAAKFWMVTDAIRRDRTDGALVRVWTPVVDGTPQAERRAAEFTQAFYPRLTPFIPN